jgi:hypothetical protein
MNISFVINIVIRLPIVIIDDDDDDDDDNDEAVYIPSILTYKSLIIAEKPRRALNIHCQLRITTTYPIRTAMATFNRHVKLP